MKVIFECCLCLGQQILDCTSLQSTFSPSVLRAKPFPRVMSWSPAFNKEGKWADFSFKKDQGAIHMCSLLEFRPLTHIGHICSVLFVSVFDWNNSPEYIDFFFLWEIIGTFHHYACVFWGTFSFSVKLFH